MTLDMGDLQLTQLKVHPKLFNNPLPHFPRVIKDKTMADKLMYIHNYDTQNRPFCRLQLGVKTFDF